MSMHLKLDGAKTSKIYEALGRRPSPQNGWVEYEEFDDHLTIQADVEGGRSITLTQYYGGAADAFITRRDAGILIKASIEDLDVRAVFTAIRETMGPQMPQRPSTNPVIIV
jgi:hypothetical protein